MYENGRKLNRHARKRKHKQTMRERYAKKYCLLSGQYDWNTLEITFKDHIPYKFEHHHPLDYWREYYVSGARRYAKDETNNKIRSDWRADASRALSLYDIDDDETYGLRNSDYRKFFDYIWTIWQ